MESIMANKDLLLAKLRENRETHVREYNEAMEGWYAAVADWASGIAMLAEQHNLDEKMSNSHGHSIKITCPHERPVSHEDDYDLAISMLEMSTEIEVRIEQHNFLQYVLDQWGWTNSFKMSHSVYSAG